MPDTNKPCKTCNAQPGERCKTLGGKTTDTHYARLSGVLTARNVQRPGRGRS